MDNNARDWSRREFLHKTASVGAVFSLAQFFLPGLSQAQTPTNKNRVTIAHGVGVYSMNPYAVTTSPIQAIWGSVMESLVYVDYDKREFMGMLAESWEVQPDMVRFKLRTGVYFHDGTPFSAQDVIASYKRILTDKESLQAPNLRNIREMTAPDDTTIVLTLKKPDANVLEKFVNRPIMKRSTAEKMGAADQNPIGTGPYKFVSWNRSGPFVMRRNEKYWGEAPKIEEVIYKIIKEDAARIVALEAGQVDFISNIPPHEVGRLKSNPKIHVAQVRGLRPIFLVLCPAYKPLDNPQVRRAITHAIDRDRIINLVLEGNAFPLTGFFGPQVFGYNPNAKAYPYDPEKAKQLLADAGFPHGFEIEYHSPTGRYPKDREVAQVIVEQLSKVGIKANLKTPEWAIFNVNYKKGKYAFYLTGRGSVMDADTLFHQYFRTGITKRALGYSNPKLDDIIDAERKTFDRKKREKLLWEAQSIILEDAPAVPLWNTMDIYAHRADLVWSAPTDEKVQMNNAYYKAN
jgi:peptide/nickel transport system substrate-binding protein